MKCAIHGTEMEYAGETPFGEDIWFCEACHAEEEARFERQHEDIDGDWGVWDGPGEEWDNDLLDYEDEDDDDV